jgi:hypothetical protein
MPLPVMALAAAGLAGLAWQTVRRRCLSPWHLAVVLWLVVPLARVTMPGAKDFDGIRHWLEIVPALAILAGLGAQTIWSFARRALRRARRQAWARRVYPWRQAAGLVVALLWLSPTLAWEVRNHPHELCYFNGWIGGLSGARARGFPDATDYWASSYRQGVDWLNEHAERNAIVTVGVGEYIVFAVREIRLREDLQLRPIIGYSPDEINAFLANYPGHAYLMYIIRPDWYHDLVKQVDAHPATYQIDVDGATILKIYRLR